MLGCRGMGRRVGECIGLCGGGSLPSLLSGEESVNGRRSRNDAGKLTVGATLRDAMIAA